MFIPFIGITDFMERGQVEAMRDVFAEAGGAAIGRRLAVGVMTSRKIVHGVPSKWDKAFPKIGDVAAIFVRDPLLFNVLHYADYRDVRLDINLEVATSYSGPNLEAVQLDMIWPDPGVVRAYRARHPNIQVILQVGKDAMASANNDPRAIAAKIAEYANGIDAVLFDKSMGHGLGMDANELLTHARVIHERFPSLALVVAGGLGPNSLNLVQPIIDAFPDVSIDAQGQLRPTADAHDPIDWDMAATYVRRAVDLFRP